MPKYNDFNLDLQTRSTLVSYTTSEGYDTTGQSEIGCADYSYTCPVSDGRDPYPVETL